MTTIKAIAPPTTDRTIISVLSTQTQSTYNIHNGSATLWQGSAIALPVWFSALPVAQPVFSET